MIMAVSVIGALVSGLIFKRHTWRVLMLLSCVVVFEVMWILLTGKHRVELGSPDYSMYRFLRKFIGAFMAIVLFMVSFKIRKTED